MAEVTVEAGGADSPATGPGHRDGAGTRQRILLAAIELFTTEGYAGTSVRDIAERTGLTKAALYYHFSAKEAVLDAITEPLVEEMRALVVRVGEHPEPPADILAALVDILSRRIGILRMVMADPSVTRKPDHRRAERGMARLAVAIAGGEDPDRLLAARCAIAAAQGGVFSTVLATGDLVAAPPDRDRIARLVAGEEHQLNDHQRREVVAAAVRALG